MAFNPAARGGRGLGAFLRFWRPDRDGLARFYADVEPEFVDIYERCKAFTMTPVTRMYNLYKAVRYASQRGVEGDVVECGVWRGGSAMVAALTLLALGDTTRRIHLYDTFEGMSQPSESDTNYLGQDARSMWQRLQRPGHNLMAYAPIEEVRENLVGTGYPVDRLSFVKGKVEETIPGSVPEHIAVLRLDTDWYESTYHELVHLYPRLRDGGALILDDYGHWQGCRKAVDQYFEENGIHMLLARIDFSARMGVKG